MAGTTKPSSAAMRTVDRYIGIANPTLSKQPIERRGIVSRRLGRRYARGPMYVPSAVRKPNTSCRSSPSPIPDSRPRSAGRARIPPRRSARILRGFLIGLVGIYVVLSLQFRSDVEPVIVMATIPLAVVGVVPGHLAMGYDLSMPSLVGASVAGIVVNNSILLVQVIKARAAEGADLPMAAGKPAENGSGRSSFRSRRRSWVSWRCSPRAARRRRH